MQVRSQEGKDRREEALASQLRLFENESFLNWLPDETVFSYASRYHVISGNVDARKSARQLFGDAGSGYQHDLPSGIGEFVRRTSGRLGATLDVIHEHTLLPYYLPFRTERECEDALDAMISPRIGALKFRLGLLTGRFRANHPLKACRACMHDDVDKHCVPYWHLCHQLPGVWICIHHGELLLESTVKSTGVGRFQWFLPCLDELRVVVPEGLHGANCSRLLLFAELANALRNFPMKFRLDTVVLSPTYATALERLGLKNLAGRRHLREAGRELSEFLAALRVIPELHALPANDQASTTMLGRMLGPARNGTHPIRHLVLVQWLFGSWCQFFETYNSVKGAVDSGLSEQRENHSRYSELPHEHLSRKSELVKLVQVGKLSATAAARQVGVTPSTAFAWLAGSGISTARRPKTVKQAVYVRIVRFLMRGESKAEVANKFAVSISTITRILRTTPGLQQAWHDACRATASRSIKKRWLRTMADHPEAGIKSLRLLAPAEYAWLYRNDRVWLDEQLKNVASKVTGNHSAIDWHQRDAKMAASVEKVLLELSRTSSAPIPLWMICQRLPELKPKLDVLDRMPLTSKVLARARRKRKTRSQLGTLLRDND